MAGAAHAASSAVVAGSCPHPIHLPPKRHSVRLAFLCSRFSSQVASRNSLQTRCRPWVSAVSEVAVDSPPRAAAVAVPNPELKSEEEAPQESQTTTGTMSALMTDVANLIKLVDTRDIVELELKHQDYELVIKKKEAIPPPAAVVPQVISAQVGQSPYPTYAPLSPSAAPAPAAAPTPSIANVPSPAPPAQPSANLPRILSPMAGTFYKSPAPSEPAFVKVGDKVSKGQVICIVEAMKLMNEIEADQAGTIVEILADDGKPVAVDTPLFAIKP